MANRNCLQRLMLGARWSSGDWCCHWRTRPRFAPGTLPHRCSDLGQVINLSLSV